jgi:hypothetical protein
MISEINSYTFKNEIEEKKDSEEIKKKKPLKKGEIKSSKN